MSMGTKPSTRRRARGRCDSASRYAYPMVAPRLQPSRNIRSWPPLPDSRRTPSASASPVPRSLTCVWRLQASMNWKSVSASGTPTHRRSSPHTSTSWLARNAASERFSGMVDTHVLVRNAGAKPHRSPCTMNTARRLRAGCHARTSRTTRCTVMVSYFPVPTRTFQV
ncbi:hypothetical protein [Corallococcus sp. 4LFB]|uniref:hypothetical protein n=1 Tax=Corallococcus sp. 4LFB TaxID=3383249 RepID=UPI0039767D80